MTTSKQILTIILVSVITLQGSAQNGAWSLQDTILPAKRHCTAGELDGKVYIIGGQSLSFSTANMLVYDLLEGALDTVATDFPAALYGAASSVVNGKIYVFGGRSSEVSNLDLVYEYDPATNEWTSKSAMPTPRSFLRTAVVNNKIYAIGGRSYGGSFQDLSTVEMYDPASDSWTAQKPMSTARAHFATEVLNGRIYAMGGWGSSASVEVFDVQANTWTQLGDMPQAKTMHGSGLIDGKIYVFGGYTSDSEEDPTWEFDPLTGQWSDIAADLPVSIAGFAFVVFDDCVYTFGGMNDATIPIGEVFRLCPVTNSLGLKAFTCEPAFYQIINGQLYRYDVGINDYTPIGPDYPDFNACGYNIENNLIYGINSQDHLVVIDAEGVQEDLGTVRNLPTNILFVSGDFDLNGHLYVGQNVSNLTTLYRIDVDADTLTAETIALTGDRVGNIDDIAFNPVDSFFYSINAGARELVRINVQTGEVQVSPTSGIPTGNANLGAIWFTAGGDMYVSNNSTGDIYFVDIESGNALTVASGRRATYNDGASCPLAEAPIEGPGNTCTDGVDNDNDGDIDCADSDCLCACFTVSIETRPEIEDNADGTATATPTGGLAPHVFSWSTDPVQTDSIATGLSAGIYYVTVSDGNGCTLVDSAGIVSVAPLTAQVTVDKPVSCFSDCDGAIVVQPAGGLGIYSYQWSDGGADSLSTDLCAGMYKVTVTDAGGLQLIDSLSLGQPAPLASSYEVTDALCENSADGVVTIQTEGGAPPYAYNLGSSVSEDPVFSDLPPGDYPLSIVDANGCAENTQVTVGFENLLPIADFSADTLSLTATFTDLSSGETTAWEWSFGDGRQSGEQNPSHLYDTEGTYTVCLTAVNGCGRDTLCQDVTVRMSTGLWEVFNSSVRLFPNPGNSRMLLTFSLERGETMSIRVFDVLGKIRRVLAIHKYFPGGEHSVPLWVDDLPNGIYLLQVRTLDATWTRKFVKGKE